MGSGESPELGLQGRGSQMGMKNRKQAATRFQQEQTPGARAAPEPSRPGALSPAWPTADPAHLSPNHVLLSTPITAALERGPRERALSQSCFAQVPSPWNQRLQTQGGLTQSQQPALCSVHLSPQTPSPRGRGGPAHPTPWPCSRGAEYKLTRQSSTWEHTNVCVFPEPWLRPAEPGSSWSRGRYSHPAELLSAPRPRSTGSARAGGLADTDPGRGQARAPGVRAAPLNASLAESR